MRIALIVVAALLATPTLAQETSMWRAPTGATLSMSENGSDVTITFEQPGPQTPSFMRPGTVTFRGERQGNSLVGDVYRWYAAPCARSITIPHRGRIENERRIILAGQVPNVSSANCQITGYSEQSFVLERVSPLP